MSVHNVQLWAAVPTLFINVKTKSLLATVLAGIVSLMILRYCM
ncbi:AzlD domain-containing protein [Paenibacillus sp. P26]|nr:AzlD domain-containing protein [Paenibacillus sp. P26]UUZ97100.1 AzlD domain-containing protein [Paenibacillus sp. P25]